MTSYSNDRSLLSKLLTWFFVALLAMALLKMAFWVVGVAVGIGTWMLFTIGPILLIGWLVLKLIRWMGEPRRYPE
jgi:hypothetical protein